MGPTRSDGPWWRSAVVYQVYIRSFADANGDGVGDIAGLRAVPYGNLSEIEDADAARALCVWVNSPANPAGTLTDLGEVAAWGRERDVPVLSDECYVEFTWSAAPATVLNSGTDGVLALH